MRSRNIEISGSVEALGGAAARESGPGFGAGEPGGNGTWGGAGAGGPGDGRTSGPGDPERPLEIIGRVVLRPEGRIRTLDGAANPSGHVRLAGDVASLRDQVVGSDIVSMTTALRLVSGNGQPVAASVRLTVDQTNEEVAEGLAQTGEDGWGSLSPVLAPDLRYRLEVTDHPALAGGALTFSYGNPDQVLACTLDLGLQGDPPSAVIPALQDCE